MKVKDTKRVQSITKTVVDDKGNERILSVEWQTEIGTEAVVTLNGEVVSDARILHDLLKEFLDQCPMAFEEKGDSGGGG